MKSNKIISQRVFKNSVENLYQAWANPELIAKWWGPNGFSNTIYSHNLQPGGIWSFVMHGPDGKDYENECEFIEIVENKYLSWYHHSLPKFTVEVNFEKIAKTEAKVMFTMIFATVEECEILRIFISEKNEENFDKLEKVLKDI